MENSSDIVVVVLLDLSLDDESAVGDGFARGVSIVSPTSDDDSVEVDSVVEYRLERFLLYCLCGGTIR